jgi:hypothetical protein
MRPRRFPTSAAISYAATASTSSSFSASRRLALPPIYALPSKLRRSSSAAAPPAEPSPPAVNPRWLSDLKARIGRCITFGLRREQQQEAGRICEVLARDWHELVAGSEGFLTEKGRRGLWKHGVVWGDMVRASFICSYEHPS